MEAEQAAVARVPGGLAKLLFGRTVAAELVHGIQVRQGERVLVLVLVLVGIRLCPEVVWRKLHEAS
jgi:hypothetical protein